MPSLCATSRKSATVGFSNMIDPCEQARERMPLGMAAIHPRRWRAFSYTIAATWPEMKTKLGRVRECGRVGRRSAALGGLFCAPREKYHRGSIGLAQIGARSAL